MSVTCNFKKKKSQIKIRDMSTIKMSFQIMPKEQSNLKSSHDTLQAPNATLSIIHIQFFFLMTNDSFLSSWLRFARIYLMPKKYFVFLFLNTCTNILNLKKIFRHTRTHKVNDRFVQTTGTSEGAPFFSSEGCDHERWLIRSQIVARYWD